MIKLNPKHSTFCPGCNRKKLVLTKSPEIIFEFPNEKQENKIITLIGSAKKKSNQLINSLF